MMKSERSPKSLVREKTASVTRQPLLRQDPEITTLLSPDTLNESTSAARGQASIQETDSLPTNCPDVLHRDTFPWNALTRKQL